jgi:hypothetical protein
MSTSDMARLRGKGLILGAYLSNLRLLKVADFEPPYAHIGAWF